MLILKTKIYVVYFQIYIFIYFLSIMYLGKM